MGERCGLCNSTDLELLETTKTEVYVIGDRRDFNKGNRKIAKVICKKCGMVQFLQNEDYRCAANEIFSNYDAMYMKTWEDSADGHEPVSQLQSEYERISKTIHLSSKGKMLDLGCGNGDALFQFNRIWPEWDLYGMDIGEQFRHRVMKREGVKGFFTSLDEIRESKLQFDFVSLNHMLCVVDNQVQMLETVHDILTENGICVILDTDFDIHPWTLFTIEMGSAYTKEQLADIVSSIGFRVLDIRIEQDEKEIFVVGSKKGGVRKQPSNFYQLNKKIYDQKIIFLNSVIDKVRYYNSKYSNVGIFGTSLAGVWVSEIIEKENIGNCGKNIFYVEEDEDALRKKIGANGYPIFRLKEICEEAVIFLPFPKYMAENILQRVKNVYRHLRFINFYEENI